MNLDVEIQILWSLTGSAHARRTDATKFLCLRFEEDIVEWLSRTNTAARTLMMSWMLFDSGRSSGGSSARAAQRRAGRRARDRLCRRTLRVRHLGYLWIAHWHHAGNRWRTSRCTSDLWPLAIFCRDGISRGASILSSIICGAVSGFLVSYLMFKNDGYAFAAAFVGALVAPLVVLLATRNPANTNSTPAPTLAEWSDLE